MASDAPSLQASTTGTPKALAFHWRTVKESLTVELVSRTYQFESNEEQRRQLEASQPVGDFDQTVEHIKKLGPGKPKRVRKGERAQ